jgi:hypothetical protein
MLHMLALSFVLLASAAHADGLDRDALLTEAPATPHSGTVRVSAGATSQSTDPSNRTSISGDLLWAPIPKGLLLAAADFQHDSLPAHCDLNLTRSRP